MGSKQTIYKLILHLDVICHLSISQYGTAGQYPSRLENEKIGSTRLIILDTYEGWKPINPPFILGIAHITSLRPASDLGNSFHF